MTCFVGIVARTGSPVDTALLCRMTEAMRARAPDGESSRVVGGIGLGVAALLGTTQSADCRQPLCHPGSVFLVADARLDDRIRLRAELRAAGSEPHIEVDRDVSDTELVGAAHRLWGTRCLDRLTGDFSFAALDLRSGEMLLARDQLGVRPLYYAEVTDSWLFSNDVAALLAHPEVDRTIDEISLADFLLWGMYMDPGRTIYRGIRCLPPGHCARVNGQRFRVERYWSPAANVAASRMSLEDATQSFRFLLSTAVRERLAPGNVGFELSGGMDSTSVLACAVASRPGAGSQFLATCTSSEGAYPKQAERRLAQQVAAHLGVAFDWADVSQQRCFDAPAARSARTLEPVSNPLHGFFVDRLAAAQSRGTRVVLTGQGGDEIMSPGFSPSAALRQRAFGQLAKHMLLALRTRGTLRGTGLRSLWRARGSEAGPLTELPAWIDPDFAARVNLTDRWHSVWNHMEKDVGLRNFLDQPWLSRLFEIYDRARLPIRHRHPFLDLRLLNWIGAVPDDYKLGKQLLRLAMKDALPASVIDRPKTPAQGDLVLSCWKRDVETVMADSSLDRLLASCVDMTTYRQALAAMTQRSEAGSTWGTIPLVAPVAFATWYATHPD